MATRVVVPDVGQTTDEMLLGKWRVAPGDTVAVGDVLAEIETDKAVADLEAYVAGQVLTLLAEEGDTVRTGDALLWIGEPGEEIDEEPARAPSPRPPLRQAQGRAPLSLGRGAGGEGEGRVLASPAARTLARERGVDVGGMKGTGPDGCVVKRDVLSQLAPGDSDSVGGTSVPLNPMRRAIAARLQRSVREAPHFYVAVEVDMSHALKLRESLGAGVSINDIVLKACAGALRDFPRMNCRLEEDTIHYLRDVNIGIAVSVDDGLLVPVLERADTLSLTEVAERSRGLTENARAGRIAAGPQAGFTVSNLGMYGVKWFSAIINPPEAAVLAVGAIEDRLVLTPSGTAARPTLTLTLSSDHRVVDGVLAARFLGAVKRRLEEEEA